MTHFLGMITCCSDGPECVKDWAEMQEHALDVARLNWDNKHATLEPQGVPEGSTGLH